MRTTGFIKLDFEHVISCIYPLALHTITLRYRKIIVLIQLNHIFLINLKNL